MSDESPEPVILVLSKFPLGQLGVTSAVLDQIPNRELHVALARHGRGDWGDLEDHERNANDTALIERGRLLSAYTSEAKIRFWSITEPDRSATIIQLPGEVI